MELRALDGTAQDVGRTLRPPPPCQARRSLAVGVGRRRGRRRLPLSHAVTLGLGTGQRLQRALAPLARTQRGQHPGRRAFLDSVSLGSEMVFCGINKLGTEWPPQGACLDHGRSPSIPGPLWAVAPEFWVPAGLPVKNGDTGTTCI